jgi:serine/threonine-protein kinase
MSEIISRLNEALSGRYEIEHKLGEGGMATVYLAHDERHDRRVAIKVLRPQLAAVIGAERFLAEIKTTANLQHPHILPLFDSGEADSFLFYVMPFVEGETLSERLDREKQLPVEEAVSIATNMAEALDYAHRQGIVHRDVKPANVLLQDGKPVIADFGIALAVSAGGHQRLTETGLSLGTPHYMSPEQATGDPNVGPATDIYALGCVLYEMLVGEPPFTGSTPQAILGKIITEDTPSAKKERTTVPPSVDSVVAKALEKLPADRFSSAGAFAGALADPNFTTVALSAVSGIQSRRSPTPATILLSALASVLALALVWMALARSEDPRPVLRLALDLAPGQALAGDPGARIAIAPDGLSFAYVGERGGQGSQIWVRDLRRLTATALGGTEGGVAPTFSPDGSRIAYRVGTELWVTDRDGDAPIKLVDDPDTNIEFLSTFDWGPDGFIYVGGRGTFRVPETGGAWEEVVPQDESRRLHLHPAVLPNGTSAVVVLGQNETRTENVIAAADFATGELKELTPGVAVAVSGEGDLLIVRSDGRLDFVPFDQDRLELRGATRTVSSSVGIGDYGAVDLAISPSGTLMYVTGLQEPRRRLVYVDQSGVEEPVEPGWTGPWESVALSPDGERLVVGTGFGASPQLWIRTLATGQMTRLTMERELNRRPVWSDDGETVTFISQLGEYRAVFQKRADGVGPAEPVFHLDEHIDEVDWSPGAEWLVFRTGMTGGDGRDIHALHVGGDSTRIPIAANPAYDEMSPALSPDGRLVAYLEREESGDQLYIRSFPNPDDFRAQVSVEHGRVPVWSADGGTLFYHEGQGARARMAAVSIVTTPSFSVQNRRNLFPIPQYFTTIASSAFDYQERDGRFIMIRDDDSATQGDLILIQNFGESTNPDG